jgi:Immunity protein family (Imm11)
LHARQMYFFNICNRLDTMDRERATAKEKGLFWDPSTGDYVFDKTAIGDRHAWKDKFLHPGLFLSDAVKSELEAAKLTGIIFHSFPAY